MGGVFRPKGETSEELEPEKALLPEPEADESGEDLSEDESEPEPDQGDQSNDWGGEGMYHIFPRFGRGRHENSPYRRHI